MRPIPSRRSTSYYSPTMSSVSIQPRTTIKTILRNALQKLSSTMSAIICWYTITICSAHKKKKHHKVLFLYHIDLNRLFSKLLIDSVYKLVCVNAVNHCSFLDSLAL